MTLCRLVSSHHHRLSSTTFHGHGRRRRTALPEAVLNGDAHFAVRYVRGKRAPIATKTQILSDSPVSASFNFFSHSMMAAAGDAA